MRRRYPRVCIATPSEDQQCGGADLQMRRSSFRWRLVLGNYTKTVLMTEPDVERFYKWQSDTFAKHGQKGVHIGSHATLYTDMLLSDMNVNTGHVEGWRTNPARFLKEWFRPMYPQIYANLGQDKRKRSGSSTSLLRPTRKANSRGWNLLWTNTFIGLSISLLWAVTTDSLRQLSE